jgi:hypothetical protein
MSSPLDLLNKFIGAVIAYGPKNKTKKARKARKARKAARRKKMRQGNAISRGNEALRNGVFIMPLQQGEVRGYDFNRSVVEFTMLNQGKVILCSISTEAMDDLEIRRGVKPDQRVDQFMRLREVIEERASRKFFEEQAQADRPVVLRANDFVR